jgi:hypothetical protein
MMDELVNAVKRKNCILFAGAGVSMKLGLPSWKQLIEKMGNDLGYDPEVFQSYGGHLELAEFYRLQKGSLGELRSWMDRKWHDVTTNISASNIHRLIVELGFPIIYTTNYDRWIENAFDHWQKPYVRIASVSDLTSLDDGKTQIVKFHGDFYDDASLVLDESSYFRRLDFESPLDIKLRADVLGKSVLFIGYSLTDVNIRLLFWKLSRLWQNQQSPNSRPTSFMFALTPNEIQERVLAQRGIKVITREENDPDRSLEAFLAELLEKSA